MIGETFPRRRVFQGHFHMQLLCSSIYNFFDNEYLHTRARYLIITRGTYLIRWVLINSSSSSGFATSFLFGTAMHKASLII